MLRLKVANKQQHRQQMLILHLVLKQFLLLNLSLAVQRQRLLRLVPMQFQKTVLLHEPPRLQNREQRKENHHHQHHHKKKLIILDHLQNWVTFSEIYSDQNHLNKRTVISPQRTMLPLQHQPRQQKRR